MSASNPRFVKGYELRERIGTGGFGVVYRAYQPSVGRDVAVKVILPEHANQPEFIRRFDLEAQIIARLEHPHIVPLYDYWRDPEGAYLVMRWLPSNLRKALERGAWSLEATARLLEQISGALGIAHREGIVHRDIKPDNLLLDEDENAYLADFGIAKDLNLGSTTEEGMFLGSPAYLTPEQIKNEPLTPRTDIYSLGLVIYEMLTNEKPYPDAKTPAELISHHLNTPLPMIRTKRPNLPAAIDEVLQTATAKQPDYRYASATRFAAAFRVALPNLQRVPGQPLPVPLTERELDILCLLVEGLSNSEIVERRVLAPSTVKWNVQQIYNKLDVHSRRQAIERAQQLHLCEKPEFIRRFEGEAATVREAPQGPLPVLPELLNPYKGLRAFQEADTRTFFGRAALTEQLLNRLSSSGGGTRFLVVVGPSGSGKSSIVRAGLIPALRKGALKSSARWFITDMLPGAHPLEELEAALLRVSVNPLPGILDQLGQDRRGLIRAVKRTLPSDADVELVLIIDQFEELFTLVADESVRVHLIDNLLNAITDPRSRVRVVLTLRADFYDRPLMYPRLAELVRSHTEVIVPLNATEMERAIVGPAEQVGLTFEAGLVATILKDVGEQPGTLPLLEYALSELYERRQDQLLTLAAYRELGGISGALARRADELYESLDETGRQAVHQMFLRLVALGEGVEDTRRRAQQAELAALGEDQTMEDVIALFSEYRLLTLDRDPLTRGPTVEIAHEALIRVWGRLRDWLSVSRDALRVQRRLLIAVGEWAQSGHNSGFLATGARLTLFEGLVSESEIALTQGEHDYITQSVNARSEAEQAERQRQARELELAQDAAAAQKRAANRLRSLVGFLALFLIVAAGLSVLALNSRADALSNFTRAEAERLAEESNRLQDQHLNSIVAALLAIRSMRLQYTVQGDEALGNADELDLPVGRLTASNTTNPFAVTVTFSRDGRLLLTGSQGTAVRLWDAQTGQVVREFPDSDVIGAAALSPDGHDVAAGAGNNILLWDAQTGQQLHQLIGHTAQINQVVFSPDGRYLLSASSDKTARLWDVQTGQQVQVYTGHTDIVTRSLAFFPDGQHVITGSWDRTVRVWDTFTGKETQRLTMDNLVDSVALSADARTILVSGGGAMLQLWDVQAGTLVQNFLGDTNEVDTAGFLPDGHTIYSAGVDFTVRLWDTATGALLRRLVGHTKPILNVAVSPNGDYLASSSVDNSVLLWNLVASGAPPEFNSIGGAINFSVAVSPNGKYVLTGGVDHIGRLWDAKTGQLLHQLIGHTDNLFWVSFSPDSQYALTSGQSDGTARLWDVQTGQQVLQLNQGSFVGRAVFSPDGKLILTNSFNNIAHVWDAQTGQKLLDYSGHPPGAGLADPAFSPDSRYVLTTDQNGGEAQLWEVRTGKLLRQFDVPTAPYASAYAPDSKSVFTGGIDGVIRQWDVQTGQQIQQIIAHTTPVGNMAISADGRFLLSAGDVTARLWDVATGQELRRYISGSGQVEMNSVAFFPDGKHVLTGDVQGGTRMWDVDYHDTIRNLCARLVRDLTDDERTEYDITDQDPTCPSSLQAPTVSVPTWTPFPTGTIPVWTPLPLTPLPTDAQVSTPAATAAQS